MFVFEKNVCFFQQRSFKKRIQYFQRGTQTELKITEILELQLPGADCITNQDKTAKKNIVHELDESRE